MLVKDIMTKDLITIKQQDTVEKCANILSKESFSGLPVLDDNGKLIGIVTEGDLIRRASKLPTPPYLEILGGRIFLESEKSYIESLRKSVGSKVEDIMTKNVAVVYDTDDMNDAATMMVDKRVKRLPVLDSEGNLVGIVSRKDVMKHLFGGEKD